MNASDILRKIALQQPEKLRNQLIAVVVLARQTERALDEIVADACEDARLANDCMHSGSVLPFKVVYGSGQ